MKGFRPGAVATLVALVSIALSGMSIAQSYNYATAAALREEPKVKFAQYAPKVRRITGSDAQQAEDNLRSTLRSQGRELSSATGYMVDYSVYKGFLKKVRSDLQKVGWQLELPGSLRELQNDGTAPNQKWAFTKGDVRLEIVVNDWAWQSNKFIIYVARIR
jgi:hypothetical protein